jgi:hypothetical protein
MKRIRWIERASALLGKLFTSRTGAEPVPPMDFLLTTGSRIYTESKYIMGVLPKTALPPGVNYSTDNRTVYQLSEEWQSGVEMGGEYIVCYNSGMGFTAVRATVVPKDDKAPHEG